MKKLIVSLALAIVGGLFFQLQTSLEGATEFLFAAAMTWGLSLSLLMSALSEWKRGKSRLPAE